jgi:hypothetical protein
VIDPILQATYLGGSYNDKVYALAIHPQTGEIYVAGETFSNNFPRTSGGAQKSRVGKGDAFVARLNSSLTKILQSTYLGGGNRDEVYAIAIHPITGDVYAAGLTESTKFPKTTGGAQGRHGGGWKDGFVARLNSDLTQILQSTYLGGSGNDEANALAIHPTTGDVYVAGVTESANFPKTTGGAQANYGGGHSEVFVARLSTDLTRILQSTYLGGRGSDDAKALVIHPKTGEVYVAGYTYSTDFPNTTGGAQTGHGGGYSDAFVARLNSNLTQILQSTYLGGRDSDWAATLAIHPTTGDVYVAGVTESVDFPNTTGGAQKSRGGGGDAFVARLSADLTQIFQTTYLGGRDWDRADALAIHPTTDDVYVAGSTASTDFPNTTGGVQTNCNNCFSIGKSPSYDAFVARLSADLRNLIQSTYLGGSDMDYATALAIHPTTGDVYVAGYTISTDFPKTTGGAQTRCNNCNVESEYGDVFVVSLTADLAAGRSSGSGSSMIASASSTASFWSILLLLSLPAFALARRIRRK